MAILYEKTPYDTINTDPSLTEQEHKNSCDINLMMKSANRGLSIRGALTPPHYGNDDMTLDALSFHIQKSQLEQELGLLDEAHKEVSPEIFAHIPKNIREKFGFKLKSIKPKNDEKTQTNDEKQNLPKTELPNPISS